MVVGDQEANRRHDMNQEPGDSCSMGSADDEIEDEETSSDTVYRSMEVVSER